LLLVTIINLQKHVSIIDKGGGGAGKATCVDTEHNVDIRTI